MEKIASLRVFSTPQFDVVWACREETKQVSYTSLDGGSVRFQGAECLFGPSISRPSQQAFSLLQAVVYWKLTAVVVYTATSCFFAFTSL